MATAETIDTMVTVEAARMSLPRRVLSALVERMRAKHEIRRSRRALERLNENDLRDIGLTRHQAIAEYRKSHFID